MNNRWFVDAWRRLRELDPDFWKKYQAVISANDTEITQTMRKLCE
jgi:hypothetical protein